MSKEDMPRKKSAPVEKEKPFKPEMLPKAEEKLEEEELEYSGIMQIGDQYFSDVDGYQLGFRTPYECAKHFKKYKKKLKTN